MKAPGFLAAALVLALLVLAPAARAADAFLKIEGAPGGSGDPHHVGWIEVSSSQVDQIRNAAGIGSATGGAGAGKVKFNEITITKKTDAASPVFAKAAASGRVFPTAKLSVRKAGGGQQEYLEVKLENVMISSYQTGASPGALGESMTLRFVNATFLDLPPAPTRTPQRQPRRSR